MTDYVSVEKFFAETTRQGMSQANTMQEALRRYMDEVAVASRELLGTWASVQQASLRSSCELQNAGLQVSQAMVEAWMKAGQVALDRSLDCARQCQEVGMKWMSASSRLAEPFTLNGKG